MSAGTDVVFLNGAYLPRSEARLSVEERGFLFGDGVYEVSPAYGGRFLRMLRRLERLRKGLEFLQIEYDVGEVAAIHEGLLERNGLMAAEMAVVYLQVTRGAAPRTHHFPAPGTPPTVFAYAKTQQRPDWDAGYSAITVPDRRWGRADIKTVQLLPNVLAQEAARRAGASDAILIRDGIALEGAHNNLFIVVDGRLITHPTSHQILPGITREMVLEDARELGLDMEEGPTPAEALSRASEIFLTGSTTEIRPITYVDGAKVGDGRAGPVTRVLCEAFHNRIVTECGLDPAF